MNQNLRLESVVSAAEELLRGESILPGCPRASGPFDIRNDDPTNQC